MGASNNAAQQNAAAQAQVAQNTQNAMAALQTFFQQNPSPGSQQQQATAPNAVGQSSYGGQVFGGGGGQAGQGAAGGGGAQSPLLQAIRQAYMAQQQPQNPTQGGASPAVGMLPGMRQVS